MTANITVIVDRRDDTLHVANTALRYMPPNVDAGAIQTTTETRTGSVVAEAAAATGRTTPEGFDPSQFAGRGGARDLPEGVDPSRFAGRGGGRGARGGDSGGAASSTVIAAAAGDSLNALPGQLWSTGEKIQFQSTPPQPPRRGQVWVLSASGQPELRNVMVGITDGSRSEVVSGDLAEGDPVMIGDSTQTAEVNSGGNDDNRNVFRMMRGGFR
jgi:HlyD family secretion protein